MSLPTERIVCVGASELQCCYRERAAVFGCCGGGRGAAFYYSRACFPTAISSDLWFFICQGHGTLLPFIIYAFFHVVDSGEKICNRLAQSKNGRLVAHSHGFSNRMLLVALSRENIFWDKPCVTCVRCFCHTLFVPESVWFSRQRRQQNVTF